MTEKEILKALGLSKKSCVSEQIVQTTHHWLDACDYYEEVTDEVIAWCEIPKYTEE